MPVAEEANVSTVREEFFSFNLDANSSAESFDKLRSRTRSFNSFWANGYGEPRLRLHVLQHWRHLRH